MLKIDHTSRLNRRYLLIEGNEKNAKEAILDYIGILGWAKAAPVFIEHAAGLVVGIERTELTNVRAAFELSNHAIPVLAVSGTLKGLDKHMAKKK